MTVLNASSYLQLVRKAFFFFIRKVKVCSESKQAVLRSALSLDLFDLKKIRLQVKMEQRVAKVRFLKFSNIVNDAILKDKNIGDDTDQIRYRRCKLLATESSSINMKEE